MHFIFYSNESVYYICAHFLSLWKLRSKPKTRNNPQDFLISLIISSFCFAFSVFFYISCEYTYTGIHAQCTHSHRHEYKSALHCCWQHVGLLVRLHSLCYCAISLGIDREVPAGEHHMILWSILGEESLNALQNSDRSRFVTQRICPFFRSLIHFPFFVFTVQYAALLNMVQ